MVVYLICLYIFSIFLQVISPKHSIAAVIEGNIINVIYVGELDIHTVLKHRCAICNVWSSPLLIALYLDLAAKTLDAPGLVKSSLGSLHLA